MSKIRLSYLGLRTGYLYDIASEDDKAVLDAVLRKYSASFIVPRPEPTPPEIPETLYAVFKSWEND